MKKVYDWKRIDKHQRFQDKYRKQVNEVLFNMREELKKGNVYPTVKRHLFERLRQRKIRFRDVKTVVMKGEMIEFQGSHLNDDKKRELLKRGEVRGKLFDRNCVNVILGLYINDQPLHVCVNILNQKEVHIKTVYNPAKEESWKWVKGRGYKVRAFYKN